MYVVVWRTRFAGFSHDACSVDLVIMLELWRLFFGENYGKRKVSKSVVPDLELKLT